MINLDYLGWPNVIAKALISEEGGLQSEEETRQWKQGVGMMRPRGKKCGKPLEVRKGKG